MRRTRQQAIGFFFNHRIALAAQCLQLRPIQHRDVPATVEHDAEFLQLAGGFGDPLSAYPKHVCDELLRHDQLVGWQAIERQ
jgi:hypothetical protein